MAPLPLRLNLTECIVSAAADVGVKLDAIGALLGMSPSHWSHVVHGRQHFPLDVLLAAMERDADAKRFAAALLGRIRTGMGLERRSMESLLMRALDLERCRMAKATLPARVGEQKETA